MNIVPSEIDFTTAVGNRLLLTTPLDVATSRWRDNVFEGAVVAVSPSGEFVKLNRRGVMTWHDAPNLRLVEVLGKAGKSALEESDHG